MNQSEETIAKHQRKVMLSHLKKMDPLELVRKIEKFRSLNIQSMSSAEITNAIYDTLQFNNKFFYIPNIIAYPNKTKFYRIRRLDGDSIPNINFQTYNDCWEPPKSCVKKAGRLNKINESLLYTSPQDPTVPLKELQIKDGEFYVLIIYRALSEIKVNLIGGNYNYPR